MARRSPSAQPLRHKEANDINHIQIPATSATVTISIVNFRRLPAGCRVKAARDHRRSRARREKVKEATSRV